MATIIQQQTCCGCFTPRSFVYFSWALNTVSCFAATLQGAVGIHAHFTVWLLFVGRFSCLLSNGHHQLATPVREHGKVDRRTERLLKFRPFIQAFKPDNQLTKSCNPAADLRELNEQLTDYLGRLDNRLFARHGHGNHLLVRQSGTVD